MDDGARVTAKLAVDRVDAYMQGHFPEFTILPGVFMLELAIRAVLATRDTRDLVADNVLSVRSMRFVAPVLLGDVLEMVAKVSGGDRLEVDARFRSGADVQAARIVFTLGGADA